MNKFKKTLAIVMATVMIAGAAPAASYAGLDTAIVSSTTTVVSHAEKYADNIPSDIKETKDGFHYGVRDDGKICVVGYSGGRKKVEIPATIDGNSVVEIDNDKYRELDTHSWQQTHMEELIIPDSVKEISEGAFKDCTQLKSVKIGNGLSIIPAGCFAECSVLEKVEFGSNVNEIGIQAFAYALTSIEMVIPKSVTKIGANAFEHSGLKKVTIRPEVKSIGTFAFGGCESLKEAIILASGISVVPLGTFQDCKVLEKVYLASNIISMDTYAFNMGYDTTSELPIKFVYTLELNLEGDSIKGTDTSGNWRYFEDPDMNTAIIKTNVPRPEIPDDPTPTPDPTPDPAPSKSIWQRILDFFKKIINFIIGIFK